MVGFLTCHVASSWASPANGFVTQFPGGVDPAGLSPPQPRPVTLFIDRDGDGNIEIGSAPRLRVEMTDDDRVVSVTLADPRGGINPTLLQRFPWAGWLAVAETVSIGNFWRTHTPTTSRGEPDRTESDGG